MFWMSAGREAGARMLPAAAAGNDRPPAASKGGSRQERAA